jgi:protein ImuB
VILAVNKKAARDGIRKGITVAQAHTLCQDLNILLRNPAREDEVTWKLLKSLQEVAPLVEACKPGEFYLEAEGLERLYGGEQQLAEKLIAAVKQHDYPVGAGIAVNKFTALMAATVSNRYNYTCIPGGEAGTFLAPLPVSHLDLDAETEQRLLQLGLRTLGQVAAFPTNELQARFGFEGWRASLHSRGQDPDQLRPEIPTDEISLVRYLANPLQLSGAVINQVRQMLTELLEQLGTFEQGCRSLAIRLEFAGDEEKWFTISLSQPTARTAPFVRQFEKQIERQRFPGGVTEIEIVITASEALSFSQLDLTGNSSNSNKRNLIDKLPARGQLYRVRLASSPLPEKSFTLMPLTHDAKRPGSATEQPNHRHLLPFQQDTGLRLLTSPEEIEVICVNGRLQRFRHSGKSQEITASNGPWKVSGNWWERTFYRQYYEIKTSNRQQYLLYFDAIASRWFIQGVFD